MKAILLAELNECAALCRRLEQLLAQDKEDFSHCVTGEICDIYTDTAVHVLHHVKELEQTIMLLQGSLQAPL